MLWAPSRPRCLAGARASLLLGHACGPRLPALKTTLAPERDRSRVFTIIRWRDRSGLCLPGDGLDDVERGYIRIGLAFLA